MPGGLIINVTEIINNRNSLLHVIFPIRQEVAKVVSGRFLHYNPLKIAFHLLYHSDLDVKTYILSYCDRFSQSQHDEKIISSSTQTYVMNGDHNVFFYSGPITLCEKAAFRYLCLYNLWKALFFK